MNTNKNLHLEPSKNTEIEQATFVPVSHNWVRQQYFDYYYNTIKTKYTINHHVDITELLAVIKSQNLKFYPTFLYIILQVVNQNDEFRMSFDSENRLGKWSYVVPSYTIFHKDDNTFSDIWSNYTPSFTRFYRIVLDDMNTYKDVKGIKAKENRPPNFCPISVLPWLSFHSMSQDTYSESSLLFPIIRFGKYYHQGGKMLIPLSVFVNHAVADGYHTAKLINEIEELGVKANEWINS